MTKSVEELNTKIQSYLEKGSCRHKTEEYDKIVNYKNGGQAGYPSIRCIHCLEEHPKPNPDYLNGNGIITVREWLEKEEKFEGFGEYLYDNLPNGYARWGVCFYYVSLATNPQAFMEHFIAYMEGDKSK
jgi:hypothetical protein